MDGFGRSLFPYTVLLYYIPGLLERLWNHYGGLRQRQIRLRLDAMTNRAEIHLLGLLLRREEYSPVVLHMVDLRAWALDFLETFSPQPDAAA